MRLRAHHKMTVALGAAIAFLFLAASPASAVVVTGEITGGLIVVQPNFGLDPIEFDLTGDTPHACDTNDDPATIDVDIVGDATSGTTEVVGVDFDTAYADFSSTTYALEIGLDSGADQTGSYGGAPSPYTVSQDLGLLIDVYETEDCEPTDLACIMDVQFSLAGDFTGTISPPATGTLVLDGGGTLGTSSCDFVLVLAFNGASATVDDLTAVF